MTIFLTSVAAVSYLLVRFGNDYLALYENSLITLPVITNAAISLTQFIKNNWWAIAVGAVVLTLLFRFATKSGTVFTVLSILVWLAGILGYLALWLPSRSLETTLQG
jgi:type II secretory pathway component PulF